MSRNLKEWMPVVSVLVVVFSLLLIVFVKMEVRRLGYSVLRESREYRRLQDQYRLKVLEYARATSPEQLRKMAVSKFNLKEAQVGQIIHMSGDQIAVK